MAEFGVEGQELKKLLKKAKSAPIAFGFSPGKSEDDSYLAMHPRKTPEVLGKDAKEQGEGTKFAFGTAVLAAKELRLTCLRELPGMAKRMKKFLKAQKAMLNVVILDKDGKLLDSDIEEDLPDDPELAEDDPDATEPADAIPPEAPAVAPPTDASALTRRLAALRDGIVSLAPEAQAKIAASFKQVVELVKAGDLERAAAGIDRLEQAVAALAGQTPPAAPPPPRPDASALTGRLTALREKIAALSPEAQANVIEPFKQVIGLVKAGDLGAAEASIGRLETVLAKLAEQAVPVAPPVPPQASAALDRLGQSVDALRERAEAVADAKARGRLLAALDVAAGSVKAGNVEQAVATIKRIQDVMTSLAQAAAAELPASEKTDDRQQEWDRRFGAIEAEVNAALSQGLVADVDELRRLKDFATASAADGVFDKALALLPKIEAMLAAGGEDPTRKVAPDVQPFARSRIEWGRSRGVMMEEARRLQGAIEARCREVGGLTEVIASLSDLLIPLESIDARLEAKLDEVVSSPPGELRDKLKAEARALIETYRAELSKPFFRDVDAGNGFAKVAVASTARDALSQVEAVLAA